MESLLTYAILSYMHTCMFGGINAALVLSHVKKEEERSEQCLDLEEERASEAGI